ncbi:MAG: cytochrome c peroxidase [Bacteroidota bacterium]
MKRAVLLWSSSSLLILIALYFSSFRAVPTPLASVTQQIKQTYLQDFRAFAKETNQLETLSHALAKDPTANRLAATQEQLLQTRRVYKRVEFLAEYLDGEYIKWVINGAPLPKLSIDDNRMIEDPSGLQILEEKLFLGDPTEEATSIHALAQKLRYGAEEFTRILPTRNLRHQQVLEASRAQMIRILSLGLTGFDKPGHDNAIEECEISLRAVHQAISAYYPLLESRSSLLPTEIEPLFSGAVAHLQAHPDFDSFDRLAFLTDYLNPLYASLLDIQTTLGVPSVYETLPGNLQASTRYYSRNIFSDSLINPFFYAEQLPEQHTPAAIRLGQLLFFDPVLSDQAERSCASCHQPDKAFTDGRKKSLARGFDGTVNRNAPTLINVAHSPRFFYDLRAEKLEKQIHHVIFDEKEFNTTFFEIFDRLNTSEEYVALFQEAFPQHKHNPVNRYTLANALSSYLITLNGTDSEFDQFVQGKTEEIDPAVRRGFNLFMGKGACGTCHFAPTFSGLVPPRFDEMESEILGIPTTPDTVAPVLDPDVGRAGGLMQEGQVIYEGSFKTVTVRNVELTAPYMHNGVYVSLEEVMDFYNRGGGVGLGLEVPYQTLPPDPLGLTEQEISDMIAFMKSLTYSGQVLGAPEQLPAFPAESEWADRKIGGKY